MRGIDQRLLRLEARNRPAPAFVAPVGPGPAELEKEFREYIEAIVAGISDEEARAQGWNCRGWPEPSAFRDFMQDCIDAGLFPDDIRPPVDMTDHVGTGRSTAAGRTG